ncbi:MAG: PAS domain-containing protein [Leptospira sp.]|jgi:PAS domain S-box-containing protein|nr:PAS domain-containing protein [Leptospira sp.]
MGFAPAGRIAIFYLLFGYVWIYFSDKALGILLNSSDEIRYAQNYKGWLFVSVSGIIIYFLLQRELRIQKQVLQEKAESDLLYRTIFERIDNAVIVFNLGTWKVEFLNQRYSSLLGESAENLKENSDLILQAVHPEDRERMLKIWSENLQENRSGISYRFLTRNGEIKWVLETRLFIPGLDDKGGRSVAVVSDITEIMESKSKLEGTLKENKILLTEIHHRVKNNLAVIISFLQLQADSVSKDMKQILEQSMARIKAIALVHEKLYSSRNLSALSADDYIGNLVENIKLMYMRMDIQFEMNIDPVEMDLVNAIPMGLIVTEMMTNSFRHAFNIPMENPKIQIKLKLYNSDFVDLMYSDTGCGFPKEVDPHKLESVGLSVIFSLSKQLKGEEINFQSAPGKGVYYHFRFPITILREN